MSFEEKVKQWKTRIYNKYYGYKIKLGLAEPRKFKLPPEYKKTKMRNAKCLCGSGKRFKNCCYDLCE